MCSAAIATTNISALVIGAPPTDLPMALRTRRKPRGKIRYRQILREYGLKGKVKTGVLRREVLELYKAAAKRFG
jgi:hypothetical protein